MMIDMELVLFGIPAFALLSYGRQARLCLFIL